MTVEREKHIIGVLGEMNLAMVLHEKGWQVFRPVVDEHIDFVITRYYCSNCRAYKGLQERTTKRQGKTRKAVVNRCDTCHKESLTAVVRFIQAKTSGGIKDGKSMKFSFHAKLRHHVDSRTFYVWTALHPGERIDKRTLCYYVFHHSDVGRFDNLDLDSYQVTDNQKTTLRIDQDCQVLNQSQIANRSYECFKEFEDNFAVLEKLLPADGIPKGTRSAKKKP